jgi:epoxyqueuosine reductase
MDACLPDRPYNRQMGGWIYGCDACQNACPFNRQTWDSGQDFPGLQQLAEWISLENIIAADYDFLRRVMTSKFWYIGVDDGWKWKNNALNAICNHYDERFRKSIKSACRDEHPHVRDMARWVALSVGA